MTVIVMNNGGGAAGTDLSQDDITPEQVREGVHFHNRRGEPKEGIIPNYSGSPKNGASPAGAGDKWTLQQQSGTKHIPAGCYLNKDIEIPAKKVGSATLTLSGKTATMKKVTGYIEGGTSADPVKVEKTVPDAVFNNGNGGTIDGNTVKFKVTTAGYIAKDEILQKAVPLDENKSYGPITANGTYPINPNSGKLGMKKATVTVNVQGQAANIGTANVNVNQNGSQTVNAGTYGYNGLSSVVLSVAVSPQIYYQSLGPTGGSSWTIDIGHKPYAVSMVINSEASDANKIVACQIARGVSLGRLITQGSGQNPVGTMGDTLTATWTDTSVTLNTNSNSYVFDTSKTYKVCIIYA